MNEGSEEGEYSVSLARMILRCGWDTTLGEASVSGKTIELASSTNSGLQAPASPAMWIFRAARAVVNAVRREGGVERVSSDGKGWRSGCLEA